TGSTFTGWSGAGCSGTDTCIITMDQAQSVTSTFTLNSYTLTANTAGTGSGTVDKSPDSPTYTHGTTVTLTATAATGSTFTGWSGDCSGTGDCVVTMDTDQAVTAMFQELVPLELPTDALITPANSSELNTSRPFFKWKAAPGVISYTITVTQTQPERGMTVSSSSATDAVVYTFKTSQTTYTPDIDLPNGSYEWVVQGHDEAGNIGLATVSSRFIIQVEPHIYYLPLVVR
ncbi:MAG: hypothetical protein ACI85U_002700, partial [Candidatus Promineifilaceae bacterium]